MTGRAARDSARGLDVRTDTSRISRLGLALGAVLSGLLSIATPAVAQSSLPLLPGQQIWANGVSSYLFGSNDTEEWGPDNVQTDPLGIIQPAMKNAHMQLERTFVFHYSIADGHRNSIGPQANTQINLNPDNPHLYDQPVPPPNVMTGIGYEVENRIKTVENMGMNCLVVLPDIRTYPDNNVDPNPMHQRIIDPDTGDYETDLDFAKKVVAYLGNRCNMYEIGNEPDLDVFIWTGQNTLDIPHMNIQDYVARWTMFVHALRAINPNAKFIGPVVAGPTGNECTYIPGTPYAASQPGDCYMRNFMHGVKGTDVEPDAISFHMYGDCAADVSPGPDCLPKTPGDYQNWIAQVRLWMQSDLGHFVPLGITEWDASYAWSPYMVTDPDFAYQWTTAVLKAMIGQKLDFATQFDTQSEGGYCTMDMFNTCVAPTDPKRDQPNGMFFAIRDLINDYIPGGTGTPPAVPDPVTPPPPSDSGGGGTQFTLTYLGSATASGTFSGNGVSVQLPPNIAAGQLLIAAVGANGFPGDWPTPVGWNAGQSSPNPTNQLLKWWWKIADGSEGGTSLTINSNQYADGGAVVTVFQGQAASPIAGVSDVVVNAGPYNTGHVTTADVGGVALQNATPVDSIVIASWQNNYPQVNFPAGYVFLSGAYDGFSFVAIGMGTAQSTAAVPGLQLQFTVAEAIINTQQIAIGLRPF